MITSFSRWLAVILVLDAVLAWSLGVILGTVAVVPVLVGGLAGTVVQWWKGWRRPEDRTRQRVVGAALREHRDPGRAWRDEVTARAHQRLARPAGERWFPGVLLGVLALACAAAAALRGTWTGALPAVLLVVLAGIVHRWLGNQLLDAARWLDDPPFPVDAVEVDR